MRKSKLETAETRRRIVKIASEEFRSHGVNNVGLTDLMAAAGLTHGGFYKHFDSKDQLIEESITLAAKDLAVKVETRLKEVSGREGLKAVLALYLSVEHRDNAAQGCPFVALGSEITHSSEDARQAMSLGFEGLCEIIAKQLIDISEEQAKKDAYFILSTMIGAVTMSRVIIDKNISSAILQQTREQLSQYIDAFF